MATVLESLCLGQTSNSSTEASATSVLAMDSTPQNEFSDIHPVVETGLPKAKKVIDANGTTTSSKKPQTYAPTPTRTTTAQVTKKPEPPITASLVKFMVKSNYPWKTNIITTTFWIGEGASTNPAYGNSTQEDSAWIEGWPAAFGGKDDPNRRSSNPFLPAHHAALCNPFYVALPFNDLAFPDKARRWVPANWHRPNVDGKQVSACRGRWVEIRRPGKPSCFAQWEDVGPWEVDHAEYVFGNERPDSGNRAGLDISPAVGTYLGIDSNTSAVTSWRFVDDDDVPPGEWLKYEEEANLMAAIKAMEQRPGIRPSAENVTPHATSEDDELKKIGISKG